MSGARSAVSSVPVAAVVALLVVVIATLVAGVPWLRYQTFGSQRGLDLSIYLVVQSIGPLALLYYLDSRVAFDVRNPWHLGALAPVVLPFAGASAILVGATGPLVAVYWAGGTVASVLALTAAMVGFTRGSDDSTRRRYRW